jgi:putative NADPH-quinone reductase
MRHVAIIQGHPDPAGGHLCHALADAYASGASAAGHGVTRVDIAGLDVPPLRNKAEFETAPLPDSLRPVHDAIVSSEHIVFLFPLWLGTMPAALKAFLEQMMRPGVAFAYQEKAMPRKLLSGRSAHLVVTMGMPAMAYRWFYGAHGVRGLERNILHFVGIRPVRKTYLGMAESDDAEKHAGWIARLREDGSRLR